MGGQATLFSSSYSNATQNRIKAAVMHHAYSTSHPKPTIPFLAMTGSKDTVAKPKLTKAFYDEADGDMHRGYVNKKGAGHLEPLFKNNMFVSGRCDVLDQLLALIRNDSSLFQPRRLLPKYTAAFMKLYLAGVKEEGAFDWENLIYGGTNENESLCGGGDGDMVECEIH